ncbi:AAA family ATPase [Candidatus Methylospira mobilis]|uniref:AAA family ATPase n=1 Tax=Candidatus Methylospira mobilis TaxID=1808979 RepID=A0A5Q0BSQ0_9GAMM|nr:ATP-binding protein [Candidatus Methylospira mobilis]QFY45214.1 AAA family ATPase [Candidatus Methylospira mobilis]
MAQADLLVTLLKSATNNDQQTFRKAAEDLIQEEKSKGHRILADRLIKSLQPDAFQVSRSSFFKAESSNGPLKDLVYETVPERTLNSLVLSEKVAFQIRELVEEQHRAELLHAHNLSPRNRILLSGPPGNGKTTLAEALACELMYPLIIIRYETLVGSYLGETSNRLKQVLDYARTQRCVLFFDEFETLGKERGDTHETGEIKRVVSSLLLQMDGLPDYVVVVAASNHPELLDRAVWRRFQLRIELPLPTREQLAHFIAAIGQRTQTNFGYTPETMAKHLLGSNFSDVEEFCLDVVRRAVLDRKTDSAKQITKLKLEQWKSRLAPARDTEITRTDGE